MIFKIGDKVRSKLNNNLVGIVNNINVSYNTIGIQSNDGNNMIAYSNQDNWELYFEVGDIVTHTFSGLVYQIYDNSSDEGLKLERFTDTGGRYTRLFVLPDDIRMANDIEKSEFYRLKELHEIKEKLDLMPLKEYINKVYGERYPIKASYSGHSGIVSEFSKELMEFKKSKEEKETNDMRKFKIGDIVEHWVLGKGTVVGYEKYLNILVKFEYCDTRVVHEDTCHLVTRGREFHDLCGRRPIPKFKQVIYNDPATIIFWEDGTKTVVKCDGTRTITLSDGTTKTVKTSEGEKYDELKGLMMGIIKKVYGLKKFYDIYEDTTKYVTGNKTLLNIEKGLAESVVKDLYGIKKINSKDDIYKVAMTDNFYVSTERGSDLR